MKTKLITSMAFLAIFGLGSAHAAITIVASSTASSTTIIPNNIQSVGLGGITIPPASLLEFVYLDYTLDTPSAGSFTFTAGSTSLIFSRQVGFPTDWLVDINPGRVSAFASAYPVTVGSLVGVGVPGASNPLVGWGVGNTIPEPSATLLGLIGVIPILRRRRA